MLVSACLSVRVSILRTMALVNADEMQAKIDRLTDQVHQLEDALRRTRGVISEGTRSVVDNAPPGRSPVLPPTSAVSTAEDQSFLVAFCTVSEKYVGDNGLIGLQVHCQLAKRGTPDTLAIPPGLNTWFM
jgi:hypothetical protein